jgi:hypothetical protein
MTEHAAFALAPPARREFDQRADVATIAPAADSSMAFNGT